MCSNIFPHDTDSAPCVHDERGRIDLAPLLAHDPAFLSCVNALKIIVIIAEVISPNKEEVGCIYYSENARKILLGLDFSSSWCVIV